MCIQHSLHSNKRTSTALLYFIAILLGIIGGYSDFFILKDLGLVISETFIKIFKCISLPIITFSIIVTLSHYADDNVGMLWKKTIFYTLSTTITAAAVACILYYIVSPSNVVVNEVVAVNEAVTEKSYLYYLTNLIPSNIFSPFLEHQVMSALLVSIVVGIAITSIPDIEARRTIANFFKGVHGIFIVITSWIVKMIPIALFGFITTAVIQLKNGIDISGLTKYFVIVISANLVQGFLILPLFLYFNKINPLYAMKGMLPALSIAFFSKSSAGTLPVTMDTIERNLSVTPRISRFVLPLCTSINMNGCAAFIFTTVIYVMQNHGIEINVVTMLIWILISTIAAIGNAGVPMGCFFLSTSLLTSMNVPIALLGLILPLYSIIDMIETSLNVWSDACVTKVIDDQVKRNTSKLNLHI